MVSKLYSGRLDGRFGGLYFYRHQNRHRNSLVLLVHLAPLFDNVPFGNTKGGE